MKKIVIMALCLSLAVCLVACGGDVTTSQPDGTEQTPSVGDSSTPSVGGDDSVGETPTTTTEQVGNVVDGNLFFGEDTTTAATTTTTKNDGKPTTTTTTKNDGKPTTTTTTKKPTTTTTVAPPQQEVVDNVKLPADGYDMDGKGRIIIEKAKIEKKGGKQYASLTFTNISKKNGKAWIIPETTKVTYACLDKDGKQIATGTIPVGALEATADTGAVSVTRQVELPAGTAELRITGHNLEYWTPWA